MSGGSNLARSLEAVLLGIMNCAFVYWAFRRWTSERALEMALKRDLCLPGPGSLASMLHALAVVRFFLSGREDFNTKKQEIEPKKPCRIENDAKQI